MHTLTSAACYSYPPRAIQTKSQKHKFKESRKEKKILPTWPPLFVLLQLLQLLASLPPGKMILQIKSCTLQLQHNLIFMYCRKQTLLVLEIVFGSKDSVRDFWMEKKMGGN